MTVLVSKPRSSLIPQTKQAILSFSLLEHISVGDQRTGVLLLISLVILGETFPLAISVSLSEKWEGLGLILVVHQNRQKS